MIGIQQGSPEWHLLRAGVITGSRIKDVMSKGRGNKPSQTRLSYMYELLAEILTHEVKEVGGAKPLAWGKESEAYAREQYEIQTGNLVTEVPFVPHKDILLFGSSPDGLVSYDGGLEMKCPYNTEVHLQTIENGMPEEHNPQVQANIAVTGREWWDFVSYDPRVPKHLMLYVQRIKRDDEFIDEMTRAIRIFEKELLIRLKKFKSEDRLTALIEKRSNLVEELKLAA